MSASKNLEIERLRAFAVLLVVYAHAPFAQLFSPFLYSTFSGVDLFFVISGFVVSGSFIRSLPPLGGLAIERRLVACRAPVVSFYLRRLFRIVPSASFYALLCLTASVLLKDDGSVSGFAHPQDVAREIVAVFGGVYNYALAAGAVTQNLAPYWSLSVEEHFYLIAPILLVVSASQRSRVLVVCTCIVIVLVVFRPMTAGNIINVSHTRFDALFYGVLLTLFMQRRGANAHGASLRSILAGARIPGFILRSASLRGLVKTVLVAMLCAALALLPGVTNTALLDARAGPNFDTSSFALMSYELVSVILVWLAALNRGWIFDIPLVRTALEYVGSRSYAIYLAHWVVVQCYQDLFFRYYELLPDPLKLTRTGYGLQFAVYVAATLLLAEMSYRLIEKPFIGAGRRVTGPMQKLEPTARA